MQYLWYYLFTINAAGLLLMLIDKKRAAKNRWRIPEASLLTIAAAGGSIGVLVGIYLFRHKTKRPKFFIGVPMIIAAQALITIVLWR